MDKTTLFYFDSIFFSCKDIFEFSMVGGKFFHLCFLPPISSIIICLGEIF